MNTDGMEVGTKRLTRAERKLRTRAELLAAARRVFVRRGFHQASLDEIAEEAGYTKGAVYSNFESKDDLFLALLEAHYEERIEAQRELFPAVSAQEPEDARRAVARGILEAYERDPAWWTLVTDFSTHASGDPEVRARLHELRERFLAAMAELVVQVGERFGLSYRLPAHEVARGTGALLRGLVLDWILVPDAGDRTETFEETVAAFLRGVSIPVPNGRAE
jgi:AcrR family transcriptional regulator